MLFSSLSANTTYAAWLRARSSAGWSNWSAPLTVTTDKPRVPGTPKAPILENGRFINNATTNRIVWSAPSSYGFRITKYELQLDSVWTDMDRMTSFVHRGLRPETTYHYRESRNEIGVSNESDALATTWAASAPERPPTCGWGFHEPDSLERTALPLVESASSDLPVDYYLLHVNGGGRGVGPSTGRSASRL